MKNLILIIGLCFLFICCKKESDKQILSFKSIEKLDTIKLEDKTQIIFINPTLSYIDSLKKSYKKKDDFYIMADDANFYMAEAGNYVRAKKVDTVNVKNNSILKIGKKVISLSKYKPWSLLLYEKGKQPAHTFPMNIQEEFDNYFFKKDKFFKSIEDILHTYNLNSENILYKNEADLWNDKKQDYILITKEDDNNTNDLLIIKNEKEGYSVVLENKNAIPCEDCGNGAESFYDYRVDSNSFFFSSSYKSNEDIYKIDFEFAYDKKDIYTLNTVTITKNKMGESTENKTVLNKNNFGLIPIRNFSYSSFLSKYILK